MYSADQRLIFPAGSRIQGKVEAVRAARHWNHGGELSLEFVKIEPPLVVMSSMSQEREIHGRLVGVQVPLDMMNQVRIDSEGSTQIARSKQRFLAPAFATVGALPYPALKIRPTSTMPSSSITQFLEKRSSAWIVSVVADEACS